MIRPLVLASGLALAALPLSAPPAAAFDPGAMSDADRAAFRAEVRAYLLDNPEVLMEAIGILQDREAAAQALGETELLAALRSEIYEDGHSWVGGNPDGDVTLVEFIDYRCGYCRRAHPEVLELVESDGNIRRIVKEFPILGDQSVLAARFAVAVKRQAGDDAYKAAHDALMTLRGEVTEDSLRRLSADLSLDADAMIAGMDDPEVTRALAANRALGEMLRINGTPTFVLGDTFLRGYVPLEAMRGLVAEARG
jgi:protein-disulfide isomerase